MAAPFGDLTDAERARYVQGMFSRIAQRYDLMNRVMTAGRLLPNRMPAAANIAGPMIAENFSMMPNRPKNSPLLAAGDMAAYRLRLSAWLPPCTIATIQAMNQNSTTEFSQ